MRVFLDWSKTGWYTVLGEWRGTDLDGRRTMAGFLGCGRVHVEPKRCGEVIERKHEAVRLLVGGA
jgi:hypothetical protein